MTNVGELNLNYICTGCGSCEVVCPVNAIKMNLDFDFYTPEVDSSKCISCNKCIDICPGLDVNNEKLSEEFLSSDKVENDYVLGDFISNYLGYSNDNSLRFKAASGGIATNILLFLLENKYIDGAIVTTMDDKNPLKTKSIIAHTAEEIIEAKTSKYCPTKPISALKNIKTQKSNNYGKKYALVGLPCQIQGLRKLQTIDKWFKNNIIFTIGLLCSHGVKYSGTEVVLNKLADGTENIKKVQYRGNGWPGGYNIEYEKSKKSIPHRDYWAPYFGPYFFTPLRCITCYDLMAELADVSLGDAWLNEIREKDDKGTSIIISRTDFSENIINEMKKANEITVNKIEKDKIKESQKGIIMRKKGAFKYRMKLFDFFHKPIPKYDDYNLAEINEDSMKTKTKGYLGAFLMWLSSYLSSTSLGQLAIKKSPEKLLKKWGSYVYRFGGRKCE